MSNAPAPLVAPGGIPIPTDRLYTATHLWILPDAVQPRHYRLGLSAYACRWGVEVYFIEDLPAVGTRVSVGSPVGEIETEKTRARLHSPIAGGVVAINEAVLADPSIITFDCYGAGWILLLEGELDQVLTPADYVALLETLPPPQCSIRS